MSVSAGTPVVPADTAPHARREVYDALVAADGAVSVRALRRRIEHRLQARVGGEIEVAGGFDKYLDPKLALFVAEGMITISDGNVALKDGFVLWVPSARHRDGKVLYVPGSQPAIDTVSSADQLIMARRRDKKDDLPPPARGRSRRSAVRDSLLTFGWDVARPALADRTGFLIDGRMRLAEFKAVSGKNAVARNGARKSWNEWEKSAQNIFVDRGLTPSLGVLRSFDENRHRLTPDEVREYVDGLKKVGIDLDRLRDAARVYVRLDMTGLDGEPLVTVTLGNGLKVTTDGESIQLRSLVVVAPLKYYDAKDVRKYLEDRGHTVESRHTVDASDGDKSVDASLFARVDDVIQVLEGAGTDPGWSGLWPRSAAKRAALLDKLPLLLNVHDEVRRVGV